MIMMDPLKPNQVLHVRENSDSELENLFKVLNHKDGTTPGQIPLSMRKLPASFFKPPDPPQKSCHSRESSNDSTHNNSNNNNVGGYAVSSHLTTGLTIAHPRAHSSPASLQQSLAAGPPPPPPGPQHIRQQSFDLAEDNTALPPGWEMAKTPNGQRYYLNHVDQSTTWHDPRKACSSTAALHQHNLATQPMPLGWEQAFTPDGESYFINHMEKTTSWFDPRLPPQLQRPGVLLNQNRPSPHHQSAAAAAGLQVSARGGGGPPSGPGPDHQRALQLQQLQMEKERLRKRQEELARQNCVLSFQEMLLRTTIQEENVSAPVSVTEMQTSSSGGVDPFLGQAATTADFHTRQESADSGLGGMGTSYGHSKTPEDFLSNVDEMETQDGGHKLHSQQQQQQQQQQHAADFSLELRANSVDLSNITDSDVTSMDSDELVPSLQEDISNELLNDVENVLNSNKMDNLLTWL